MQQGIIKLMLISIILILSLLFLLAYFLYPYGIDLLFSKFFGNSTISNNNIELVWQHPIDGRLVQDFILYKDKVYFTTNNGILYSLDENTGKIIWTYSYGEKMDSNSEKGVSILADNNIIFIHRTFYNPYFIDLIAVDSKTGQEKWIKKFENTINPITAKENTIIVLERPSWENQVLKALRNDSGQETWSYPIGNQRSNHLAIVDDVVYFFHIKTYPADVSLEAIELFTGSVKWTYKLDGSDEAFPPFKINDLVIFGQKKDKDHSIIALDARTGTKKWSSKSGILFKPPQLWNNTLIFNRTIVNENSESNFMASVDVDTGNDKWVFPTSKFNFTGLIVDQGRAYFGDAKYFYSIDANTGKLLWKSISAGAIDPATKSDNVIFYRELEMITFPDSSAHFFRALNSETGKKIWSWKDPIFKIEKGERDLVFFVSNNTIYSIKPVHNKVK